MQRIGEELQLATKAFTISGAQGNPPRILDMCMAPGGFLKTALTHNPGSYALAFSLPHSNGGHKSFIPREFNVEKRFLDVTMLAADMGMESIDNAHEDAGNFLPRQFISHQPFDLVICDGQVLRTHIRASYRERREAKRLTTTQLALGLQNLKPGGTMVVLLHKIEAWDTANLIREFSEFASVRLLKPKKGHANRSSFYMVATNIRSQGPEAVRAVAKWKRIWRSATFDSDEEYQEELWNGEPPVEDFLRDFGPQLAALGEDIWKVQAEALARAWFVR
ncbi:uncharacterized protein N7482_010134 [Penicillium canariense]|uniref:Ribosomal RNA methyltransferase FtsJ domain-containing protein n=1 Tax=Penicillium canariense TaxID=189055 RepID=A0A9W9HMF6_9EURO|nr:uncharacterized protein N7482_010134 [Penicillium canariense]KAJ5150882.1 hypothetical protein N7482_010134 [Penicillium canariense]